MIWRLFIWILILVYPLLAQGQISKDSRYFGFGIGKNIHSPVLFNVSKKVFDNSTIDISYGNYSFFKLTNYDSDFKGYEIGFTHRLFFNFKDSYITRFYLLQRFSLSKVDYNDNSPYEYQKIIRLKLGVGRDFFLISGLSLNINIYCSFNRKTDFYFDFFNREYTHFDYYPNITGALNYYFKL